PPAGSPRHPRTPAAPGTPRVAPGNPSGSAGCVNPPGKLDAGVAAGFRPERPVPRARPAMSERPQRLIEAARKAVPEGTYAVGLGLVLSGLTAYGFQILAFRGLSQSDYAALNGLWIFLLVVAPGFFLP